MKAFVAGVFALSLVFVPSVPALAQSRGTIRSVQLISMSSAPARPTSGEAPESNEREGAVEELATSPARFAVHDLQRRWVEFQMANSFSAAGEQTQAAISRDGPADPVLERDELAGLSIPAWMRGGAYSSVPVSVGHDCYRVPYQPAGFLASEAEIRRAAYYAMMSDAACAHGVPVALFDAMIIQESRYNAAAVSPKNAFGLTQLMPNTALGLGVDRFDSAQNLSGGARYLRQQLDRFGQFHLALAAYNAGPGNVKNGRVPPFAETRAYVDAVLSNWRRLAFGPRGVTVQSAAISVDRAPRNVAAAQPVRAALVSVF
jgi:hypothetical protein